MQKYVIFVGKESLKSSLKSINYWKVRDHYIGEYRGAAYRICNIEFNVPNEISAVFHKGSNYDYAFIIKELVNEFKGQFKCFQKSTEKHKTFFVPIEMEVIKVDKEGNESVL